MKRRFSLISLLFSFILIFFVRQNIIAQSLASIKPLGVGPYAVDTPFTIQVKVGDPNVVTDLYGISFKIKSDKATCTYIDGSSVAGSFLGSGPFTFFKKVDAQTVDMAITKTSASGVNGSGVIAQGQYTSSAGGAVTFTLLDVSAVDSNGATIPMDVGSVTVSVGGALMKLSGVVRYNSVNQTPVSNALIALTATSGTNQTTVSGVDGSYSFDNLNDGQYTLTATKTGNWGGVNATDALVLLRHSVGLSLLTGLPLAVADVNNSGSVNGTDALLIVRRSIGLDTSFVAGDWVFASQQVTINGANVTANISGLCVGDVNASYIPSTGTVFK